MSAPASAHASAPSSAHVSPRVKPEVVRVPTCVPEEQKPAFIINDPNVLQCTLSANGASLLTVSYILGEGDPDNLEDTYYLSSLDDPDFKGYDLRFVSMQVSLWSLVDFQLKLRTSIPLDRPLFGPITFCRPVFNSYMGTTLIAIPYYDCVAFVDLARPERALDHVCYTCIVRRVVPELDGGFGIEVEGDRDEVVRKPSWVHPNARSDLIRGADELAWSWGQRDESGERKCERKCERERERERERDPCLRIGYHEDTERVSRIIKFCSGRSYTDDPERWPLRDAAVTVSDEHDRLMSIILCKPFIIHGTWSYGHRLIVMTTGMEGRDDDGDSVHIHMVNTSEREAKIVSSRKILIENLLFQMIVEPCTVIVSPRARVIVFADKKCVRVYRL